MSDRHILSIKVAPLSTSTCLFGSYIMARLTDDLGVEYGLDYTSDSRVTAEVAAAVSRDAADKLWPMAFSERKFSD